MATFDCTDAFYTSTASCHLSETLHSGACEQGWLPILWTARWPWQFAVCCSDKHHNWEHLEKEGIYFYPIGYSPSSREVRQELSAKSLTLVTGPSQPTFLWGPSSSAQGWHHQRPEPPPPQQLASRKMPHGHAQTRFSLSSVWQPRLAIAVGIHSLRSSIPQDLQHPLNNGA